MGPERLITIIREDLSAGYQIAQTAHAVANYCLAYRERAIKWHIKGNYIISLSVENLKELTKIIKKLERIGLHHVAFYEPDINEYTSIAFVECDVTKLITANLPLAGNVAGIVDKDTPPQEPLQQDPL